MSLLQVEEQGCGLELNSLSKTFNMAGWSRMVLGNANAIDAVLKVSNMDSGMFTEFKGGC
jgi:aspartate/methionine/tyrosine aminotransferase